MVWNTSFLKTLEHHIDSNNTGRLILISFLSTLFPGIEKNSKFKVGLSPSKTVDLICLNESLLQALCVLKIFTFLSWLFWSCRKTVWKELQGKFQNMTSQTATQTITMNMLPNISKSEGNQTMKFGQLIEYTVRNIFLQKSCRQWDNYTSFRPLFVF